MSASCCRPARILIDPSKAAVYYDKGCEGGEPSGCANLALLYRDGTGVPADRDKAAELLARACRLGDAAACGP